MAEDLILLLPWGEDPRANRGGAGSSPIYAAGLPSEPRQACSHATEARRLIIVGASDPYRKRQATADYGEHEPTGPASLAQPLPVSGPGVGGKEGRRSPAGLGALPSCPGYAAAMTELPARPSPQKAAELLGIYRYAVTAASQATHDRLVAGAPWAAWAEQRPAIPPLVTWLVTVFAVDNDAFLTLLAHEEDKVLIEVLGTQPGDTEPPATQIWSPWSVGGPDFGGSGNGHHGN